MEVGVSMYVPYRTKTITDFCLELLIIPTSHKSSTSFVNIWKPQGYPSSFANRLQRWAATLLGYEFRIEWRKPKDFGKADALSRLILSHSAPDEEVIVAVLQAQIDMDVLTSYLPVTFDKSARMPRRMYCYKQ
jgi:hypothetical protein